MEELGKALRRFGGRDVPLIIGGGIILLSLSLLPELNSRPPFTWVHRDQGGSFISIFLALSYVLGYCAQEIFSFTCLVNTSPNLANAPSRIFKAMYKCWTRTPFPTICAVNNDEKLYSLYDNARDKEWTINPVIERILFVRQLGHALGSSCLTASVLILITSIRSETSYLLFAAALIPGLLLLVSSWMQTLRLIVFLNFASDPNRRDT